jgi:hypothetical protein
MSGKFHVDDNARFPKHASHQSAHALPITKVVTRAIHAVSAFGMALYKSEQFGTLDLLHRHWNAGFGYEESVALKIQFDRE